jgi:two-component system phosphate regulon response regulator OmpR
MDGKAPRILVVDDDPELRALLQRFLREHGFEVRVADTVDAWIAGQRYAPTLLPPAPPLLDLDPSL